MKNGFSGNRVTEISSYSGNRFFRRKNSFFLFQDKEQPDTEDQDLNSVPFNALLAIDDPNASQLADQSGADGFQMDSTPLFQVRSHTRDTRTTGKAGYKQY